MGNYGAPSDIRGKHMSVNPIPAGYHTVTPYLIVKDAAKLIVFLQKAFDAKEMSPPMKGPDGTIHHAEIMIGNSPIMLSEATAEHPPMPTMLYLYVDDVDAVYKKAIAAGGMSVREPENQFYGDRSGGVIDHCGNQWWVGTHVEDVPPEELGKRAATAAKEKHAAKA